MLRESCVGLHSLRTSVLLCWPACRTSLPPRFIRWQQEQLPNIGPPHKNKKMMEKWGVEPHTSRMLSERSTR